MEQDKDLLELEEGSNPEYNPVVNDMGVPIVEDYILKMSINEWTISSIDTCVFHLKHLLNEGKLKLSDEDGDYIVAVMGILSKKKLEILKS